jgi:hypothetical protein
MATIPPYPAATDDILSWTNQDTRESVLFNSWGVLYRFQVRIIAPRAHTFIYDFSFHFRRQV